MTDLFYDGQTLTWRGYGAYKATSGMAGLQEPRYQCISDGGPIPEGNYRLPLAVDKSDAQDDGTNSCTLRPASMMQHIPRGPNAGACERYWANWGFHRIRLEAADAHTRTRYGGRRSGFYIHDSTKGYSHGCIEVEGSFFSMFTMFLVAQPRGIQKRALSLSVRYQSGATTNGGTKRP
jgi:hypothetical protein